MTHPDKAQAVRTTELLLCPFCGGRAELKTGCYTQYVQCLKCGVMGNNLANKQECIEAWNTRAALSAIASPVEERTVTDNGISWETLCNQWAFKVANEIHLPYGEGSFAQLTRKRGDLLCR